MERMLEFAVYTGPDGKGRLVNGASYPIVIYIYHDKWWVMARRSSGKMDDYDEFSFSSMSELLKSWSFPEH